MLPRLPRLRNLGGKLRGAICREEQTHSANNTWAEMNQSHPPSLSTANSAHNSYKQTNSPQTTKAGEFAPFFWRERGRYQKTQFRRHPVTSTFHPSFFSALRLVLRPVCHAAQAPQILEARFVSTFPLTRNDRDASRAHGAFEWAEKSRRISPQGF